MDDLLFSMSQSLTAVKPPPKIVDNIQDRTFDLRLQPKPPREMFYRHSIVCQAKPPVPYLPEICTAKFVCLGAKAAYKCLNCCLYDPKGYSYLLMNK
jgi:hypothetical protein